MIDIRVWNWGLWLGDWYSRLRNLDKDWGLGTVIGDCDWGLGLGIGIGDLGLGIRIWDYYMRIEIRKWDLGLQLGIDWHCDLELELGFGLRIKIEDRE